MAMIDYGAVVIVNGIQINYDMFQNMKETVGWSDHDRVYRNPSDGEEYAHWYMDGNVFAFIGGEDITLGFYKNLCRVTAKDNYDYLHSVLRGRKSARFEYNGYSYRIREVCDRVHLCSMRYGEDNYNVIYGYGIDCDMEVWNKVKNRYLGKRNARKVDNLLRRLID